MLSYVAAGFSVMFLQPLKAYAEAFDTIQNGEIFDADSGVITDNLTNFASVYHANLNVGGNGTLPPIFIPLFIFAFIGVTSIGFFTLVRSI